MIGIISQWTILNRISPPGDYTFTFTRSDKTTFTSVATLPDYDADSFPEYVPLDCTAGPDGVLKLNWSTVADVDDYYDIWATNLNTFKDIVDIEDEYHSHPQDVETTLTGTAAGKNDYEIGVEAQKLFAYSIDSEFVFKSESSKFVFKTDFNLVKQCSITAGKTSDKPDDSILIIGQLNATDSNINAATQIVVSISSADMVEPYSETFDINAVTWKKGKFISSRSIGASSSKFTFDAKTHQFTLLAKNKNLTGLWCPFTLTVEIGDDYTAEMTVDEKIANGASKSVPIQLMMGVRDVLQVTSFKPKFGKTDYSDTLTIKGVFTIKGDPDKNKSLVVNLGSHCFTVPGDKFAPTKGYVESCKAVSNEGASVVSSFDFSKCAFSVVVTKANITDFGLVDFDIDILGNLVSNSNQLDLGPQRVFGLEDLRQYDVSGAHWTYDADFSYAVKVPGGSGKDSDSGTGTISVNDEYVDGNPGYQITVSSSGAENYTYWFHDSYGAHWAGESMSTDLFNYDVVSDLVFPELLAVGRTYSSSAPFTGSLSMDVSDYVPDDTSVSLDFQNFAGTASNSIKLIKKEQIDVPNYGTYDAVRCVYTGVVKGSLSVSIDISDDVGDKHFDGSASFTTTATQTFWAVPGMGIVAADSKMSTKLSISRIGTVSLSVTESDDLVDYYVP